MESYLKHYGVKGMKKGVNRYYNPDGTLTAEGRRHYKIGSNDKIHYTSNGFTSTSSDGQRTVGVANFTTSSNKKPTPKDGWHVSPFKPTGSTSAKVYPAGAKGPGSLLRDAKPSTHSKAYPAGAKGPGSLLRDAKPPTNSKPNLIQSTNRLTSKKPTSDHVEAIPLKPKKASDEKKPMSLKKKDRAKKLVKRPNYSTLKLTDLR